MADSLVQVRPTERGLAPILLVEDEPTLLETIAWFLEDEGLPVRTAANGREALCRLGEQKPSLVILDMNLPYIDGYGVAAGIRAAFGDEVPILVVTADGRAAENARQIGAAGYLDKPFDIAQLLAAVWQHLRR